MTLAARRSSLAALEELEAAARGLRRRACRPCSPPPARRPGRRRGNGGRPAGGPEGSSARWRRCSASACSGWWWSASRRAGRPSGTWARGGRAGDVPAARLATGARGRHVGRLGRGELGERAGQLGPPPALLPTCSAASCIVSRSRSGRAPGAETARGELRHRRGRCSPGGRLSGGRAASGGDASLLGRKRAIRQLGEEIAGLERERGRAGARAERSRRGVGGARGTQRARPMAQESARVDVAARRTSSRSLREADRVGATSTRCRTEMRALAERGRGDRGQARRARALAGSRRRPRRGADLAGLLALIEGGTERGGRRSPGVPGRRRWIWRRWPGGSRRSGRDIERNQVDGRRGAGAYPLGRGAPGERSGDGSTRAGGAPPARRPRRGGPSASGTRPRRRACRGRGGRASATSGDADRARICAAYRGELHRASPGGSTSTRSGRPRAACAARSWRPTRGDASRWSRTRSGGPRPGAGPRARRGRGSRADRAAIRRWAGQPRRGRGVPRAGRAAGLPAHPARRPVRVDQGPGEGAPRDDPDRPGAVPGGLRGHQPALPGALHAPLRGRARRAAAGRGARRGAIRSTPASRWWPSRGASGCRRSRSCRAARRR